MNGSLPEPTSNPTPDKSGARSRRAPRGGRETGNGTGLSSHGTGNGGGGAGGGWVGLLKMLADPIRLRILRLLESQAQHGLSVGELADILKLPQSTVSRHLKTLLEGGGPGGWGGHGGVVEAQRDGTSMLYRLSAAANETTLRRLRDMSRQYLDEEPLTRTDDQRLAHILRLRQDATESFFGKTASEWDQIRSSWFGETFHLEALLALLDPHWVVGDLGTGTGVLLPLLAPHVAKVIAVDPSTAMLKSAKERVAEQHLDNVEIRRGTLEDLPIEDHALDVAIVALVLHHVSEPPACFKQIRRVLKTGGRVLVVDLQPHAVDLFREKMQHRWMGFAEPQLVAWLQDAGFAGMRWHALPAREGRSDEGVQVPDMFMLRAEAV